LYSDYVFCCLDASAHPRDLLSFPTRRSSDLVVLGAGRRSHVMTVSRASARASAACDGVHAGRSRSRSGGWGRSRVTAGWERVVLDRKSTRLNSSHVKISYAVFCLKKKKRITR